MPHDAKHVTNTRRLSYYIIAYILSTDVNTKIKNGEAETTISFFCDFSTVFLLKKNSIDFSVFFLHGEDIFFWFYTYLQKIQSRTWKQDKHSDWLWSAIPVHRDACCRYHHRWPLCAKIDFAPTDCDAL